MAKGVTTFMCGPGDFNCRGRFLVHNHDVDLHEDLPSDEQVGDLPAWIIVQLPSLLDCLALEIDWNSIVGEMVWTLAMDALSQPDEACMTVKECFRVAELLTGFSVWDSVLSADGDE